MRALGDHLVHVAYLGPAALVLAYWAEVRRGSPHEVRHLWLDAVPQALALVGLVGVAWLAWRGRHASLGSGLVGAGLGGLLVHATLVVALPLRAGAEAPLAKLWALAELGAAAALVALPLAAVARRGRADVLAPTGVLGIAVAAPVAFRLALDPGALRLAGLALALAAAALALLVTRRATRA